MKELTETETINKWIETGLLDGLDERMKRHNAIIFEKMSRFITYENFENEQWLDRYETIIFPVIRHICGTISKDTVYLTEDQKDSLLESLDAKSIAETFSTSYQLCFLYMKELTRGRKVDLQAETCARIAEDMGNRYVLNYYFDVVSPRPVKLG